MALGAWGESGGYRQPFCQNFVVFVDNTCNALLTVLLGNFDKWQSLVNLPQRKHHKKYVFYTYTHENAKISPLHYFNFGPPGRKNVDWPSVRFLPVSCSMLLRCDFSALWRIRIYISEGKVKIELHLFGPKCKNTIINSECKPFSVELKAWTTIGVSIQWL